MKKFLTFFLILAFSYTISGQTLNQKFIDSTSQDFLVQILSIKKFYLDEGLQKEKMPVLTKPAIWNPYSFFIPDSIIPKNDIEKFKFYNGEYGVYIRHFVFKNKTLDSILTQRDREFMQYQASLKDTSLWKFTHSKIAFITSLKNKKYSKRYVFSKPVFSKDYSIAIIEKLVYQYDKNCFKDCEIGESSEADYFFKKNIKGKWELIGSGPTW